MRALLRRAYTFLAGLFPYLAYFYLLRVPLAIWLALTLLPVLSIPARGKLSSVARGLFDLSDPDGASVGTIMFFAVFAALMLAATLALTSRLILVDSHDRCLAPAISDTRWIKWMVRLLPAIMVASLTAGLFVQTGRASPYLPMWIGAVSALAAFGIVLFVYHPVVSSVSVEGKDLFKIEGPGKFKGQIVLLLLVVTPVLWVARQLVRLSPKGYIDESTGELRSDHSYALLQLTFSLLLYGFLFWIGPIPGPVTLVFIVAMLLCWLFAGLTFFFDRFRIPLLAIVAAYAWLTSFLPMTDSFYPSIEKSPRAFDSPGPTQILQQHAGEPAIVVASAGGGIQAAAWTARVLAGLHQDLPNAGFDRSVTFLSGVSGGSVGIMYFAEAYQGNGRLAPIGEPSAHPELLDRYSPVAAAEASSLENVTFGLAYPDLIWSFLPFFRGVSYADRTLVNGHNLTTNRGTRLDEALKRTEGLKHATMSQWRDDTIAGTRPAVAFNATIVETGERMLMATTRLENSGLQSSPEQTYGRRYFSELYPSADLAVVTAARLSATFPYVTPAARIWRGGVSTKEYHIVDGGYYDNYGTATLIDWLDRGLSGEGAKPSKVLVLAIRSFPEVAPDPPDGQRGLFFQLEHPVTALGSVRHTGQLSRSQTDLRFLLHSKAYSVPVTSIVFEYSVTDPNGHPLEEPLSWHLTPLDKQNLHVAWNTPKIQEAREYVRRFLSDK